MDGGPILQVMLAEPHQIMLQRQHDRVPPIRSADHTEALPALPETVTTIPVTEGPIQEQTEPLQHEP